ncbi:MAG: hypothetical protein KGL15_07220 [Acidobacteriota bacterium]|nr:hypothetical protein [Acidobacteriota bacterium]
MLALAAEPTAGPYAGAYHERHELPTNPTLQTALAALRKKEIVGVDADGRYRVIEPFLSDWLAREARDDPASELTRPAADAQLRR